MIIWCSMETNGMINCVGSKTYGREYYSNSLNKLINYYILAEDRSFRCLICIYIYIYHILANVYACGN